MPRGSKSQKPVWTHGVIIADCLFIEVWLISSSPSLSLTVSRSAGSIHQWAGNVSSACYSWSWLWWYATCCAGCRMALWLCWPLSGHQASSRLRRASSPQSSPRRAQSSTQSSMSSWINRWEWEGGRLRSVPFIICCHEAEGRGHLASFFFFTMVWYNGNESLFCTPIRFYYGPILTLNNLNEVLVCGWWLRRFFAFESSYLRGTLFLETCMMDLYFCKASQCYQMTSTIQVESQPGFPLPHLVQVHISVHLSCV